MMKNSKIYKLGAVAMLLAMAACQQEDVNPNYDPETNSVLTQFVLNFNTKSYQTKQSAAETQAVISSESPFRGIKETILMSFIQADEKRGQLLDADMDATEVYPMDDILSAGSLSNTSSRRVMEMSLPLKTNTMLFYGRAMKNNTGHDGYTADDCYGKLDNYEISKTANSANFRLGVRLQSSDYDNFNAVESYLAGILTIVMNYKLDPTAIVSTQTPAGVSTTYDYDIATNEYTGTTDGTIHWSDYATKTTSPFDGSALSPLESKLGNVYSQMTTIHADSGELRAASGPAIMRTMQDVWTIINSVRCSDPTSKREAVAKYFAEQVDLLLQVFFTTSAHDGIGSPVTISAFRALDTNDAKTSYQGKVDLYWPTVAGADGFKPTPDQLTTLVSKNYNFGSFPTFFNLPRGATHVRFDSEKKCFYYPSEFNTSAVGGTPAAGSGYNEKSYYYPAELLYFGNSPVRTSDNTHATTQYPNGANTTAASGTDPGGWDLNANWSSTDWNGNYVKSSTRSVAMQYDINYGVALLKTQVGFASGITQLEDNNHYVQKTLNPSLTATDEPNNKIDISGELFDLVGIIIGGQHQNVDWQYLPCKDPKSTSATYDTDVTGFVYDRAVPANAKDVPAQGATAALSNPNYTLLFDNYNYSSDQDKVYIALEFLNNGPDFYGNFNLIRSGGYFYLIGELDPAQGGDITWPSNTTTVSQGLIPPYNTDGTSKEIKRVFIQDFMTSVSFRIGQYSLQYAYLTVPDLRASSVTLGLSVDLTWETGLNFSDIILGGTTDMGSTTTNP